MDQKEAIELVKTFAPKGATILSVVKKVDKDGMGRVISFAAISTEEITQEGKTVTIPRIRNINGPGAYALDLVRSENPEGVYMEGTGMNMSYAFVRELGVAVWDDPDAYQRFEDM